MKLLTSIVAYLAATAAVVGAVWLGLSSVGLHAPKEPPVLAMGADGDAPRRERVIVDVRDDPNRVPIWIAPTPKYTYAPVTIEPHKQDAANVGKDARGAMAKAGTPSVRRATAEIGARIQSNRDSDPFFRD
jgi:hypothetical protein